jgi:hypothetical protein
LKLLGRFAVSAELKAQAKKHGEWFKCDH